MKHTKLVYLLVPLFGSTLGAPVVAIGPTFGDPIVSDNILLHDTQGKVGWVEVAKDGEGPGEQPNITAVIGGGGDFFIGGDYSEPLLSFNELSVGFAMGSNGIPSFPAGTPYYIRRTHELFGCMATFGYVGATFGNLQGRPVIVLPVDFSSLGIPNREINAPREGDDELAVNIHNVFVADDVTTASLGVAALSLFATLPPSEYPLPEILLEYLPGNTHSGSISWQPTEFVEPTFHWGEPFSPRPDIMELGTPAPIGPARITFTYDGYTSTSITLNLEKKKYYHWNPVVEAITGLTPSGYTAQAGILDQGVADAILGECNPSATLSAATDPNQDGRADAADFTYPDPEK